MTHNPCTDKLTDIEYLNHMIPHHQVAIDMCKMLIKHTSNPVMLHLCRNIIRKQGYEIWEMEWMTPPPNTLYRSKTKGQYLPTSLDFYEPIMFEDKKRKCNPLFFKPDKHAQHQVGTKITIKSFLQHMIPHHQVAIDMSKRLLLHTSNSYLYAFCHGVIRDQQAEIYNMNYLLANDAYYYNSNIL
jgi:uncharacterized protein (DUF305 family)